MRILVTGAAGFAGAHIADNLAQRGHEVYAGWRQTSFPSWVRATPLQWHRDLDPAYNWPRLDVIVHAAATAPGLPGITDADVVDDGVPAVKQMLALATASGARGIIYLSSISVYGTIDRAELNEQTPIVAPGIYGRTKFLGERLIKDWVDEAPTERAALSLRLPGVLGRGARRCWLSKVAADLSAGREVVLHSPHARFNNAVHVDDLCRFIDYTIASVYPGYNMAVLGAAGLTTPQGAVERLGRAMGAQPTIRLMSALRPCFTIRSNYAIDHLGYAPMHINEMLDRYGAETVPLKLSA